MGFSAPASFEILVPNDEKGFFLRRGSFGTGAAGAENVQFSWDYAQDGLSDDTAKAANTLNKVLGIEMVYVEEGAFYAGDGASTSDYRFVQGSADAQPWYIQTENAITTTNAASGGFYYQGSGAPGESSSGAVFTIPQSFPKGYEDFYVMKYELTEGQWVSPREFDQVNRRIGSIETSLQHVADDVKSLLAAHNRDEGADEARKEVLNAQRDGGARKLAWGALGASALGSLWWIQDAVAKITHHG